MSDTYPAVGFYFQIQLEEETNAFKEVSGLSLEMSAEQVVESGENKFKHRVPTAAKYQNLILKRGIIPQDSKLMFWIAETFESGLESAIEPKTIQISLLNESGVKAMSWLFVNAYPVRCQTVPLNDTNDEILVESVELAFQYFTQQELQKSKAEISDPFGN